MKPTYQKNRKPYSCTWLYAAVLCGVLFTSCTNMKKVTYMNDVNNSEIAIVDKLEPVIQKNDLLSIQISSPNVTASQLFNTTQTVATNLVGYTSTQASGYLVDQDGYIDLPMLGRIKAAGLTKKELTENITNVISDNKLLMHPVVNVRYLNFKITVLGEVAHPMVINAPDEKINILQALGFAGDMTVYARRDNVILVREEDGKRITKRLDLNSGQLLNSPYYYLKSNDVIYVEPNKAKIASVSNTHNWLPSLLSGLSLFAVILDRIIK